MGYSGKVLDLMEYANDAAAQVAYASSDDKFAFQLREHKFYSAYNPDVTFSEPSAGVIRCNSTAASLGRGYVFVSLPRAWLDGKKIALTWETSSNYANYPFYAKVYDGAYDRSSNTDFPDGANFLIKGAGLLHTIEDLTGTNASHTVTTVVLDLSAGTEDYVTIIIYLHDGWDGNWGWYQISNLQILDASNNVLWSYDSAGDVVMEVTGTYGDYGLYGNGNINLTCFSESTIKVQGSYSLKGIALITDSLNDTLTRTIDPTISLLNQDIVRFDVRASRTGTNIQLQLRDSGLTLSTHNINIKTVDTWQTEFWNLGQVALADKDAIDRIVLKITNADADNTFYVDNIQGLPLRWYKKMGLVS